MLLWPHRLGEFCLVLSKMKKTLSPPEHLSLMSISVYEVTPRREWNRQYFLWIWLHDLLFIESKAIFVLGNGFKEEPCRQSMPTYYAGPLACRNWKPAKEVLVWQSESWAGVDAGMRKKKPSEMEVKTGECNNPWASPQWFWQTIGPLCPGDEERSQFFLVLSVPITEPELMFVEWMKRPNGLERKLGRWNQHLSQPMEKKIGLYIFKAPITNS